MSRNDEAHGAFYAARNHYNESVADTYERGGATLKGQAPPNKDHPLMATLQDPMRRQGWADKVGTAGGFAGHLIDPAKQPGYILGHQVKQARAQGQVMGNTPVVKKTPPKRFKPKAP